MSTVAILSFGRDAGALLASRPFSSPAGCRMMAAVGGPSIERDTQDEQLLAFALRLRRRHRRSAVLHAALRVVLAVAVPAVLVAWLLPAVRWPLALAVLALTAWSALAAAWRARRIADTALLRVGDAEAIDDPRGLAELGDELATWLEGRGAVATPMRAWLAQDVRAKLPALSPSAVAALGRRRLGGLLWVVPIALLLLLAWFLTNLLSPPWPGALGGRQNRPDASSGDGGNGAGGQGGGQGQSDRPQDPDDKPRDQPARNDPQQPPPPPPQANEPEPPKPEPPAPMLELPSQQRFIVPEFFGDGPTRRARMHAAEVEQGAPAGASPTARSGQTPPSELPPPTPEQFARAAEAALAARHVPPAEQAMVRRFFAALQKAAK